MKLHSHSVIIEEYVLDFNEKHTLVMKNMQGTYFDWYLDEFIKENFPLITLWESSFVADNLVTFSIKYVNFESVIVEVASYDFPEKVRVFCKEFLDGYEDWYKKE